MKATTKLTRDYLESLNSGLYTVLVYDKVANKLFISSCLPAPEMITYVVVHSQQGCKNGYTIEGNIRATQRILNDYIKEAGL